MKKQYCSECKACERKEAATVAVSYHNEDGRWVRGKLVCAEHADMLASDFPNLTERKLSVPALPVKCSRTTDDNLATMLGWNLD